MKTQPNIKNIVSGLPFGTHTVKLSHDWLEVDGVVFKSEGTRFSSEDLSAREKLLELLAKLDVIPARLGNMTFTFVGTGLDVVGKNLCPKSK